MGEWNEGGNLKAVNQIELLQPDRIIQVYVCVVLIK